MSEKSDNSNNKPRFTIPSASQVYNSTTPPTNTNFIRISKTFSNSTNETETQPEAKKIFSNVAKEGETQTTTKVTSETNSSGDDTSTVKRFSNKTTTITATQASPDTSSAPSTSASTYKSSQKPTSLPRIAEPTASKFGPGGSIHVNPCQRGNPILSNVRSVPWEYKDIIPDYVVGRTTCVLYLSLKYHKLYPDYIYQRVQKLRSNYNLRIILCRVDIQDPDKYLQELTKLGINANFTLFLAWNDEEAGQYLESFKMLENQNPQILKEKSDNTPIAQLTETITKVRGINKTDVLTLASNFGSFKNLLDCNVNSLALCPGFGLTKAQRLKSALDAPFKKG